jgi:hypothetical protein
MTSRPAAVRPAVATLALAVTLAVSGAACGRIADGDTVRVSPLAPHEGPPAERMVVGSGPLLLRPTFAGAVTAVGQAGPPAPPLVPKVPTHGIVLDDQGPVPVAAPVAVRIPSLGLVSHVVPVGVDQGTGELSVPADPAEVGWYRFGAAPGGAGAAVLAGHVDWKGKPGAFLHLDRVQPGERVEVDLGDGTTHAFVVAETHLILKTALPAELFARNGPAKLVLITCGGEFDRSIRRYKQNVVVVATPAA